MPSTNPLPWQAPSPLTAYHERKARERVDKHAADRVSANQRKREKREARQAREAAMDKARRRRNLKLAKKETRRKGNPRVRKTPRLKVYERDDWCCVECGYEGTMETLTVDHIRPWGKGGSNRQENLQTMCAYCNNRKGGKWDGRSGFPKGEWFPKGEFEFVGRPKPGF